MSTRRWHKLFAFGGPVAAGITVALAISFYGLSGPTESIPAARGVILLSSYATSGKTAATVSIPNVLEDEDGKVKVDFVIELSSPAVDRPPTIVLSGDFVSPDLTCVGESLLVSPEYLSWNKLSDLERLGIQRYEMHPSGSGVISPIGNRTFSSGLTDREAVKAAANAHYLRIEIGATGFVPRTTTIGIDGKTQQSTAGMESRFSCYFEGSRLWHAVAAVAAIALWHHFDFPSILAISNNAGAETVLGKESVDDYIGLARDATIPREGDFTYTWSDLSERQQAQSVTFRGTQSAVDTPQLTVELRGFSILVSSSWVGTIRNVALWSVAILIPLMLAFAGRFAWVTADRFVETGTVRREGKS